MRAHIVYLLLFALAACSSDGGADATDGDGARVAGRFQLHHVRLVSLRLQAHRDRKVAIVGSPERKDLQLPHFRIGAPFAPLGRRALQVEMARRYAYPGPELLDPLDRGVGELVPVDDGGDRNDFFACTPNLVVIELAIRWCPCGSSA